MGGRKRGDVTIACPQALNNNAREAAELAVRTVKDLCNELNIPALEALGVFREQFDHLADDALKEIFTLFNPRQPTKDDVKAILEQAFFISTRKLSPVPRPDEEQASNPSLPLFSQPGRRICFVLCGPSCSPFCARLRKSLTCFPSGP